MDKSSRGITACLNLCCAGFRRSLPRLGRSRSILHRSPGTSLALRTGDRQGRAATARSSLLGGSGCSHGATSPGTGSTGELTATTWVSGTWARGTWWGGRSSVSCRRNPLEAPSRAGGGLILPRSPARGGDSSPYTRQDRRSPFAPPLPPQMTWTGSWESSRRISSRHRPKPTAAERGEGSEQAGAAPAAGRVPVPPCLRCVCFGAGEPRGTLRGRVPGGNPSVPPIRC